MLFVLSKLNRLFQARIVESKQRPFLQFPCKVPKPDSSNADRRDKVHPTKVKFAAMKLQFVPSAANFVMVNVGDGALVFKKLLARKIIVRPLKGYNLPEWIRISVGTMEQNRQCIAALKEILPGNPKA